SRTALPGDVFYPTDPSTNVTYTLSLHDALPISLQPWVTPSYPTRCRAPSPSSPKDQGAPLGRFPMPLENFIQDLPSGAPWSFGRSEEHTSELQSRGHLVCRLLLEKKNFEEPLHG